MAEKAPRTGALSILSFELGGFKVSSILLAILAVLGSIPLLKAILANIIADHLILSTAAVILSAVVVYYLLLAETGSEILERHSMAFVLMTVAIILVAYTYVPIIREMLSKDVSETIGQVVTLLARR